MGFHFDSSVCKAMVGPMYFFTDPSSSLGLHQEMQKAIDNRLSFYAYRLKGDTMFAYGCSEFIVEGLGTPGYAIGRFLPGKPILTIPFGKASDSKKASGDSDRFPAASTTEEGHRREVKGIVKALGKNGGGKTVAARVIVEETSIDLAAAFLALCKEYPHAYVFAFSTPLTGCWIGASPEILLESRPGKGIATMALAGTRPAGSIGVWDEKNVEEQALVTSFIMDTLTGHGLNPIEGKTITMPANNIEHICTPISADAPRESELEELLADLSPTPAVCGLPKGLSLKLISEYEDFDRGCYGGFCGPYRSSSDFTLMVTLRCARIEENRLAVFAGGGITRLSDPSSEWTETTLKSSPLVDLLKQIKSKTS